MEALRVLLLRPHSLEISRSAILRSYSNCFFLFLLLLSTKAKETKTKTERLQEPMNRSTAMEPPSTEEGGCSSRKGSKAQLGSEAAASGSSCYTEEGNTFLRRRSLLRHHTTAEAGTSKGTEQAGEESNSTIHHRRSWAEKEGEGNWRTMKPEEEERAAAEREPDYRGSDKTSTLCTGSAPWRPI